MTRLGGILSQRRYALTALAALVAYALLYLAAAQLLVWQPDGVSAAVNVSSEWRALLFRERAPFLYEPIGVLALGPALRLYLAVPNLVIALLLGALVGLNAAVSYHAFRASALPGARGIVSLLGGAVPSLIGGAACCVPTLVLVLGLQTSATLIALWPLFIPASALLLAATLWWSLARDRSTHACSVVPSR